MEKCIVKKNAVVNRSILDDNCVVGEGAKIGIEVSEYKENELRPDIYNTGITVLGENTVIPGGVSIGKNCVVHGATNLSDYEDMALKSGGTIMEGVL
jgi:glucose-1-phosphate adenylyltransferase